MALNLRNLIDLTLPEYLIIIAFGIISYGLIIQKGIPAIDSIVLPFFAVSFGMICLNTLNNIVDIELDKINKPSRPLPSGRITLNEAKFVCIGSFSLSIIFSYFISFLAVLAIIVFILLAVAYSVPPIQLRKYFLASNIIGGIEYSAIPFILVWFSIGGKFPLILFLFVYFLVFLGPFIKDFEDIRGERKFNYKTLPILLGEKRATMIIFIGYLLLITATVTLALTNIINFKYLFSSIASYLLLIPMAVIFRKELGWINKQKIVTQARMTTYSMIIVSLIQLSYGLANIL